MGRGPQERIVSLAAVAAQPPLGGVGSTFQAPLLDPGVPITAGATNVHHITDAAAAGQPRCDAQLLREFFAWVRAAAGPAPLLLGYGGYLFDCDVLRAAVRRVAAAAEECGAAAGAAPLPEGDDLGLSVFQARRLKFHRD